MADWLIPLKLQKPNLKHAINLTNSDYLNISSLHCLTFSNDLKKFFLIILKSLAHPSAPLLSAHGDLTC